MTVLQTDNVQLVPLTLTQTQAFYRAREIAAPALGLESLGNPVFRLTLRGLPGTRYKVQTATDLTSPVLWSDLFNLTLTNTSATFNWTNTSERRRFFRAFQP
jgi:hypothetical protein